jgi:DNA mismatch repair protein MutL
MGKITCLPADLASQIAAGEVVERPASVVKELIENALDAGARRITVTVELGGKRLVRVEDDGEGMAADDARLALERHATSKIARAEDLAAIRTLGFRGEALPSMAAVSHFVLRTSARGADSGTEIRVNGGAISAVQEVGAPEGTLVEVADLFYNLPARRKFLKSDGAESAQISRVVTQFALGYPETGFTLVSARRTVLQCPPVATREARVYQLYGERSDLVPVRRELSGVELTGYVAALAEQGPTRGPQNLFVNRRIVKDRTIAHAVLDAYSGASIKERSPEIHLFLEVPPDRVDVNVHPAKAEVRFLDQSFIHEVVRRAVADALGQGAVPELQLRPPEPDAEAPMPQAIPGVLAGGVYPSRWIPEERPSYAAPTGAGVDAGRLAPRETVAPGMMAPERAAADIRPMVPLGQFRDTFIIAVDSDGIAVIDQHVAHERVLFEQVMDRLNVGRLESQRLLEPVLVQLALPGRQALVGHSAELERLGFEVEEFGGETLRVTAVPALLTRDEAMTAVRALADDLEGLDRGGNVGDALRRIAATTACQAAVKANCPLTYEKMTHILDELRRTAYSTICPHGRPVMLRLTRREIEKNFQRI